MNYLHTLVVVEVSPLSLFSLPVKQKSSAACGDTLLLIADQAVAQSAVTSLSNLLMFLTEGFMLLNNHYSFVLEETITCIFCKMKYSMQNMLPIRHCYDVCILIIIFFFSRTFL